MRVAAAISLVLLLLSEFTIMFSPVDRMLHGTIAVIGIALSIAFALNKPWAASAFLILSGYCALKYSIMPAIYLARGYPWTNFKPSILTSLLLGCFLIWLWFSFVSLTRGAIPKTLLISAVCLIAVYGLQALLLLPAKAIKGTLAQNIGETLRDGQSSVDFGYDVSAYLSTQIKIEELQTEELLLRAPTFRLMLKMPLVLLREEQKRELTKAEVQAAIAKASYWPEIRELWEKGGGIKKKSLAVYAQEYETFSTNYLYRSFYWAVANKLISEGKLSKEEIDRRAQEEARKQVTEILKFTNKDVAK